MDTTVEAKYPNRPTRLYRFVWEDCWIDVIIGLREGRFVAFGEDDKKSFDLPVVSDEFFEIVFLIRLNEKRILRLRSLSPCVYEQTFVETDTADDAAVDQMLAEVQKILDENPEIDQALRGINAALDRGERLDPDSDESV